MNLRALRMDFIRAPLQSLSGPAALSWQVFAVAYPFTVLTVLWTAWATNAPLSFLWFVIGTLAHAALTLVGLTFRAFHNTGLARTFGPLYVLSVFVILGMVRGATVATAAPWLGADDRPMWAFRITGGVVLTLAMLTVLTWAADNAAKYLETTRNLIDAERELGSAREGMAMAIQQDRKRILDLIATSVSTPLEAIKATLLSRSSPADVSDAVGAIDQLIDDAVKPVSRSLAAEVRTWEPLTAKSSLVDTASPRAELTSMRIASPFRPLGLGILVAVLGVASLALYVSPLLAVAICITAGVVLGAAAALLNVLWNTRGRSLSISSAAALLIAGSAVLGLFAWVALLVLLPPSLEAQFGLGAAAVTAVQSAVLGGVSIVRQAWQFRQDRLREAINDVAVVVAGMSREIWSQQNRIAEVLHGEVQSSLIVLSAHLQAEVDPGPAALDEHIKLVETALNRMAEGGSELDSFTRFISEVQAVWAGVVDVHVDITGDAHDALDADATVRELVAAIVRESVSNSHRHGRAKVVRIDLALTTDGRAPRLALVVTDDGAVQSPQARPGLGTQLLNAAALTWSRQATDSGTQLSAEFPLLLS
jgi:signal transduction histidine kinase